MAQGSEGESESGFGWKKESSLPAYHGSGPDGSMGLPSSEAVFWVERVRLELVSRSTLLASTSSEVASASPSASILHNSVLKIAALGVAETEQGRFFPRNTLLDRDCKVPRTDWTICSNICR